MKAIIAGEHKHRCIMGKQAVVPYFDGNGRMGKFIMNLMMASGGYPWTIVPVTRRDEYMQALEVASAKQDIVPFTKLLASLV